MKMNHQLLGLSLLLIAGCVDQQALDANRAFFPAEEGASVRQVLAVQDARGARLDGTLYAHHFDGPNLNSLGRQKLSLMLRDSESALPLVVYADLKQNDPLASARRDAVKMYLSDAGLQSGQFKIETGVNPATLYPAAPSIAKLSRTDSEADSPSAVPPKTEPDMSATKK